MDDLLPIKQWHTVELLGPLNDIERQNAPKTLYTQGDVGVLRHGARIAVVGARKVSSDGLRRAKKLAQFLVQRGAMVVSGLAAGVDRAAHEETIAAGGRTMAVLGTGLDLIYPPANADLHRKLAREHLLLTQFPCGTPIQRGNFPRRNRTMALLCDATVIVEASDSSGTLSQGWEAIRLGRPLFVLRSLVENKQLKWPAEMIRYGATMLAEPDQLLPLLGPYDVRPAAIEF